MRILEDWNYLIMNRCLDHRADKQTIYKIRKRLYSLPYNRLVNQENIDSKIRNQTLNQVSTQIYKQSRNKVWDNGIRHLWYTIMDKVNTYE